jgi:hypothetical protein
VRAQSAERLALAGPAARARLRAAGDDPSQSKQARARRGAVIARRNAEAAAWERAHPDARSDPDLFRSEILPALAALPLSKVMAATGLSKAYCSQIRSGRYLPHPRHWQALKAAVYDPREHETVVPAEAEGDKASRPALWEVASPSHGTASRPQGDKAG